MFIYKGCPIVPKPGQIDCSAMGVLWDRVSQNLTAAAPLHQLRSQSLTGLDMPGQFWDTMSHGCPTVVPALPAAMVRPCWCWVGAGLAPGAPGGALGAAAVRMGGRWCCRPAVGPCGAGGVVMLPSIGLPLPSIRGLTPLDRASPGIPVTGWACCGACEKPCGKPLPAVWDALWKTLAAACEKTCGKPQGWEV